MLTVLQRPNEEKSDGISFWQKILRTPLDYVIIGIILLILWGVAPLYVGGPISWDELLYMNLSLNPAPEPFILNRYFHIYLQVLFFQFSAPLLAVKIFWSFLISLTGFLVYVCARNLSKGSNYLNGLIAILFFFSQSLIFRYAGVTYADFTAMMMMTLAATIYLLYHRSHRYRHWLLVALGLSFFFALKSKETAICLSILFLGLIDGRITRWRDSTRNLAFVLIGIGTGLGIFMVLDQIFLGDALFGLRPSHIEELFAFNLRVEWDRPDERNWYSYIFGTWLLYPFLLYLINFAKSHKKLKLSDGVLWLIPLVVVVFLTVSTVKGAWGVIPRYLIPAIPMVSILAGQLFHIKPKVWLMLSVFGAILISTFVYYYSSQYPVGLGWDKNSFLTIVVLPIALSVLLALIVLVRKWGWMAIMFSLTCLFLITFHPLTTIITDLKAKTIAQQSDRGFYPFAHFSKYINYTETMSIFVSTNLYEEHRMLCKQGMLYNAQERCSWMFNLFFEQNARIDQFAVSNVLGDIVQNNYDYIFLTQTDWLLLQYSPKYAHLTQVIDSAITEGKYIVETDPEQRIVFIRKHDPLGE